MKRSLLPILASIAVFGLAGPALARPRLPRAVDFELAPPTGAHTASGGVASGPQRAPGRFSLVGLRWRGDGKPAISLRVRASGTRWSRWLQLPGDPDGAPDPGGLEARGDHGASPPVWVGTADWVQYRLSRPVPGLQLHFVRVERNGWSPRAARAQAGRPAIQPRSAWDPANQCPPRIAPDYGEVDVAFVHHTVSLNSYRPADVPSIILGICRFHRNSNGWNDIGYNFLVDRFGTLWEGRAGGVDQPVVGAQAQGYNAQSTGIANIGSFDSVPETAAALSAMARLIRWKLPLSGAPTAGSTQLVSAGGIDNRYRAGARVTVHRVSGHRDVDATDCPGGRLYAQIRRLRQLVGSINPTRERTRIAAWLQPPLVVFPHSTRVRGSLAASGGAPLAGTRFQVQLFRGTSWYTVGRGASARDGSFSLPLASRRWQAVRVIYAGNRSHLPGSSHTFVLVVRPAISLRPPPPRAAVGSAPPISGTIRPSKRRLRLVITHRVAGRMKRVASLGLRARRGRFRSAYRLPSPGLFGYTVLFGGDSANVPARSATVYVRASQRGAR